MTGVEDTGEEEGMKMLPTDSTVGRSPQQGFDLAFFFLLAKVVSE